MSVFTGSTLAATRTRDGNTAGTSTNRSWEVEFAAPFRFESYVCDMRAAGTYTLSIDGVDVATVVCAAASVGKVFAPVAPMVLSAGVVHTFDIRATAPVLWYVSNAGTSPTGTGGVYLAWGFWLASSNSYVDGTLNGKIADGVLVSGITHDTVSSGSFAAQTWPVTFDTAVVLVAVRKKFRNAVTYALKVDGSTVDSITKAWGTELVDHMFYPASPLALAAGARTFKFEPATSQRFPYRAGTGTAPTGDGSSHTTAWGVWGESTGNKVPAQLFFMLPLSAPTAVSGEETGTTTADLEWSAPASGVVDHYEVRVDGGAWSTATSPHTFTGLSPGTDYDLEVRAVGDAGTSAPVLVTITTESIPTPPGYYRVALTLGSHSWEVVKGEGPTFGPTLPLSLGWDIPDNVDFFPSQSDIQTLTFGVRVTDASELADVVKGTKVTMAMYVDADPGADPWQTFEGVVTQLDGETLPSIAPGADAAARDFRMTVYAGDDNARLADMFVGYTDDWPVEHISERLDRICDEAGITRDNLGVFGVGMVGWLRARPAGAALSALSAIRETLKDAADDYDSEPPDHYYGRYVFHYNHDNVTDYDDPATLYVSPFRRRVFPGSTVTLDGGLVHARTARWTKQPGPAAAEWVIVDGSTFGTPGAGVPYVRNTSLFDTFDVPGEPVNYSSTERDNLGESLLPDGSTALDGWGTRLLRYAAYVDPEPVALWASQDPMLQVIPVVITPISDELEVNGEDYLAGTLTGARMTLAPGGRFYVDIRLRSELLPGTDLP